MSIEYNTQKKLSIKSEFLNIIIIFEVFEYF